MLLVLGGCATSTGGPPELRYDPALLSGERMFGEVLDPGLAPAVAVSAADAQMQAYVAAQIEGADRAATRLRRLLQGLLDDGYFATRDDTSSTLTAAEAFRTRAGNCLAYTNLFVALAREAGLDTVYQVVDVPPSWEADAGFLIRYTHVNVLVRGVRPGRGLTDVTVDFNVVQADPEHQRVVVSDEHAAGLYYANRAVDMLRRDQTREAFAYLRRAIELAPENADLWVNLGAFYATRGDLGSAIEAYGVAEQIAPANRTVVAALARTHAKAGNHALAAAYDARARNYLEANPYYHLAQAQGAYLRADHAAALASIDRALALERRSGRLHFVKALIEEALGNVAAARESYRLAERYGVTSPQKRARIERAVGTVW